MAAYADRLRAIDYLANICVVLELTRSLSELYWMNVNDPAFPFCRRHRAYQSRPGRPLRSASHRLFVALPARQPIRCSARTDDDDRPLYAAAPAAHVSRSRPRMHPRHACLARALRPAFGAPQLRKARAARTKRRSKDFFSPAGRGHLLYHSMGRATLSLNPRRKCRLETSTPFIGGSRGLYENPAFPRIPSNGSRSRWTP